MGKYQVAIRVYICKSDLQHYFLSKLKFLYKLNFTSCNDIYVRR
jgi:hypothetical protein